MPREVRPICAESPWLKIQQFIIQKKNFKQKSSGNGYFEFRSIQGIQVKSYFKFNLGDSIGYFLFRYKWDGKFVQQILRSKCVINNYGHKMWRFVCPGCQKMVMFVFFTNGPHWICQRCSNFSTANKGRNLFLRHFGDRKKLKTISKDISSRSIQKKKLALERLISIREEFQQKARL